MTESWRQELLAEFRAYGMRAREPQETEMAAEFARFLLAEPDCLLRLCAPGHFTASAWILDGQRERTLLTHHRKLDKWLQLGGHADGEGDLRLVALKEANEESGLTRLQLTPRDIFDLDRHWIPERKNEAAHWHYDVRFVIIADGAEKFVVTHESKDLAWVPLAEVARRNPEESMVRMVRKTGQLYP